MPKPLRKNKKRVVLVFFAVFLFMLIMALLHFEARLSKIVVGVAENTVKAKASILISSAIYEQIEKDDITYDKLVTFEKDESGHITALKTNIIEVNRLKSQLAVTILQALGRMTSAEFSIPIGTVIGGDLLGGKGPGVRIQVIPVGSVDVEIDNEISSAGINQSRHQIMMKVKADLTILNSANRLNTFVETYVCIAETVIVGEVPQSYTNNEFEWHTAGVSDKNQPSAQKQNL